MTGYLNNRLRRGFLGKQAETDAKNPRNKSAREVALCDLNAYRASPSSYARWCNDWYMCLGQFV